MDGYRLSVEQQLEDLKKHTMQLLDQVLANPSRSNVQAACEAMDKGGRLARPLAVMSVAEGKNDFCYIGPVYNKLFDDICMNLFKQKDEYGVVIILFEKLLSITGDIPDAVKNLNETLQVVRETKAEYDAASAKAQQAANKPAPAKAQQAANKPARPANPRSRMSHSEDSSRDVPASSSSDDSGCGGCLLLLLLPAIGGAIAGPIGAAAGFILAIKLADN